MWCMESPELVWCGPEPTGATMQPSTNGDGQLSEPDHIGRHQTRRHLSISSFSEVFGQRLRSSMLEKATQGTSKKKKNPNAQNLSGSIAYNYCFACPQHF